MPQPASHTAAMNRLIQQLSRLPGLGKRSAERVAYHLLKQPAGEAQELAGAIHDLKKSVRHCAVCFNLTEGEVCSICADPQRDHATVLVVEQPSDVVSLESTGMHRGVYHVLMGRLSPLDGIGAGELNIASLVQRVKDHAEAPHVHAGLPRASIREIILGTNPTLEGDGTALYLSDQLAGLGVKVSRLARGLPSGSNLELVSKAVLADAIAGRQEM
jgi:recombination protein RecR